LAQSVNHGPLLATADYRSAHACYVLGRYKDAIALLRPCVTSDVRFSLGDDPFEMGMAPFAAAFLALALAETGDLDEAGRLADWVVEVSERADNPWSLSHGCLAVRGVAIRLGEAERAVPVLQRGVETCRARDLPIGLALLTPLLGYTLALSNRVSEGLALLAPSGGRSRSSGMIWTSVFEADVVLRSNDLDRAAQLGSPRWMKRSHAARAASRLGADTSSARP
jgi:tetratricopeptide (TPR) repeat protein